MRIKTLKAKLTLITLLPMLLTLLFITMLVLQEFVSNIEEELDSRAHDIAVQAGMMSEFYLYTGDVDALATVAQNLMHVDGIGYIRFINNTGQLLIQKRSAVKQVGLREYSFPIFPTQIAIDDFSSDDADIDTAQLGTIELGLSSHTTQDRRYQTYQRLFFISVGSLLLGFVLIVLFNRKFNAAIGNLISTAKAIENGKLEIRCMENGTGELLEFQQTFNTMARAFEQNEQDLKAKVEAATASLIMTVQELSEKNDALAKSRQETIQLERAQAISDERERIMKDMHDGIGGQLVASLALLEQEADTELTDNIRQILSDCLDDLRMIINSLHTANTSLAALLADFKYRMNKKLDHMGISLRWHIDDVADTIHVAPQMGLNLLRILQEAFTNILKHAHASQIQFSLALDGQQLVLMISDDGQFNPTDEQLHNGLGIRNMKSRATNIGAEIMISQAESGGCLVTLSLPIKNLAIGLDGPPANEG